MKNTIITVGLAPAWDKTIEIAGVDWNEHKVVESQSLTPAGKALNINKALSWMGKKSIAAGLWGSEDFQQMKDALMCHSRSFCHSCQSGNPRIKIALTKVPGRTRENITIVDTKNSRQIHLRSKSALANAKSIKTLKRDLHKTIKKDAFVVFAGAMPNDAVELVELAKKKQAKVVVDTSGDALKKVVAKGGLFLIKPNVEELGELVGRKIKNDQKDIIAACKKLLTKVKMILVSRGEKGAMLICDKYTLSARYAGKKYDVCNTVACGDYLLAGFISFIANASAPFSPSLSFPRKRESKSSIVIASSEATRQSQTSEQLCALALSSAIKSATAKAFGLNEKLSWPQVKKQLKAAY